MQKILSLIPLFLCCLYASAQFKVIGESEVFKPEGANIQIELLPGGNTMIFLGSDESRQIDVYDKQFKKISSREITPAALKSSSSFTPAYTMPDGNIMMLTHPYINKVKELHRVQLDGKTGAVLKEEKLGELKKTGAMDKPAKFWASVPEPDFTCILSKSRNYYAIVAMNSFESDRNKRIEVVIYNKDHKELSRAFYLSPDDRFKYMRFLDGNVTEDGKAYIVAEGHNTRASGGKERELLLAELEPGKKEVTIKMITNIPLAHLVSSVKSWYLPKTKQLMVFSYCFTNGATAVSYVNTATGVSEKNIIMVGGEGRKDSEQKFEAVYGRRPKLNVWPQNLIMHEDGSFATIDEGLIVTADKMPSGRSYDDNTERRDIVVHQYDAAGNYLYCNIIPRNHYVPLKRVYPFSSAGGIFTTGSTGDDTEFVGEGFKTFMYVDAGAKKYLLLNDEPGNGERVANGKRPEQITRAGDTDPFVFELKKAEIFSKRTFLFDQNNVRKKPLFLDIGAHDELTGRMILLRQEKGGKKKNLQCKFLLVQHEI